MPFWIAKRCFRPLTHLTKICSHPTHQTRVATDASREYREESGFSNLQFAPADTAVVACSRFHRSCQSPIAN
jgi:hypothetical protein